MSYQIVNMWVPSSKYSFKAPFAMKPTTLTIHETGNNATARGEVAYMRGNNSAVSYHVAVDDKEVVQAIPFNRNAYHAGDGHTEGGGNLTSIGLEICYNKDNGFGGSMSDRMLAAIDNAALYAAYILKQYNWGTDRLRMHYNWSGKNCPMKIRNQGKWNWFVGKVQDYLDEINGKKTTTKAKAPAKPKATGSTYTVRSGDSLWAIARANDTTVAKLKSLNGLKSNTIQAGQKIKVSGTAKKTSTAKKSTAKKTPYTVGEWKTNKHGTQYIEAHGTFTVTASQVLSRFGSPMLDAPSGGWAKRGWSCEYHEMVRQDGHVWVGYMSGGKLKYVPVRTWNRKNGKVGTAWGRFS